MLVDLFLPAVLTTIMFSLGLGLHVADFTRVLRVPKAFALGAFNQVLVLPVVGFCIAVAFALPPELAVGVMVLVLCPGGVLSNALTRFAKGSLPLSISLTAVISLLSIVTMPIFAALSVRYFMGGDAPEVDVTALGLAMFGLTAVPVAIGMVLTRLAPTFTAALAPWMSRIAIVLFVILIVAAIAINWTRFLEKIAVLGPALICMNLILLAIGVATSRLAGLSTAETTTVAVETGIQNGTLGIAVSSMIVGSVTGVPEMAVPTALYSILTWSVSIPFALWRRRVTDQGV